jgi:hypothetical protein
MDALRPPVTRSVTGFIPTQSMGTIRRAQSLCVSRSERRHYRAFVLLNDERFHFRAVQCSRQFRPRF